jgi:transposase
LFEAALGIAAPWFVAGVRFDENSRVLTVGIDFTAGTRFAAEGAGRPECLRTLNMMNINHLSLFPDIYGSSLHCNKSLEIDKY